MKLSKILPEDHVKTAILMAIEEKRRVSVISIVKGSTLSGLILAGLAGLLIFLVLLAISAIVKPAILATIIGPYVLGAVSVILLLVSLGKLTKVKEFTKGLSASIGSFTALSRTQT